MPLTDSGSSSGGSGSGSSGGGGSTANTAPICAQIMAAAAASAHLRPPRISTAPSRLKSSRISSASGATGSGPAATKPDGRQLRVLLRTSSNGVYCCPSRPTPIATAAVAIASTLQPVPCRGLAILENQSTEQSSMPSLPAAAACCKQPRCYTFRFTSRYAASCASGNCWCRGSGLMTTCKSQDWPRPQGSAQCSDKSTRVVSATTSCYCCPRACEIPRRGGTSRCACC